MTKFDVVSIYKVAIIAIVVLLGLFALFVNATLAADDTDWNYHLCAEYLPKELGYHNVAIVVNAQAGLRGVPVYVVELSVVGNVRAYGGQNILMPGNNVVLGLVIGRGETFQGVIRVPGTPSRGVTVEGSARYPECGVVAAGSTYEAILDIGIYGDPGACYFAYIYNGDGGSSRVADEAHPGGIVWQADSLGNIHFITGGGGQSIDPADYYLEPTTCQ